MLTIKQPQWKALATASEQSFQLEMANHLGSFAPELTGLMGRERLMQLVQHGLQRGRAHGFTTKGPLRSYLETTLALGADFDTDPALARATACLKDPSLDPVSRAEALHEGVSDCLDQVNGAQHEHAMAAIRRIQNLPFDAFSGSGNLGDRALALFRGGFPEKYAYAGEASLRQLLLGAGRVSEAQAVRSDVGRLVIAFMLYTFGHGVFSDPAYAWAGDTVRDTQLPEEERAQLLYRKARVYLRAVLEQLAKP